MSTHPTRMNEADFFAEIAAVVHTDTQGSDKKSAARHGRNASTVNRWRNWGKGSPVYECIRYVMACIDPERVAATILAAARMRALADKTTSELIAMYWECRRSEAEKEARDRALDSLPPSEWDWSEKADATARDGGVEIRKEAIQRIFAARKVAPADVLAWSGK